MREGEGLSVSSEERSGFCFSRSRELEEATARFGLTRIRTASCSGRPDYTLSPSPPRLKGAGNGPQTQIAELGCWTVFQGTPAASERRHCCAGPGLTF